MNSCDGLESAPSSVHQDVCRGSRRALATRAFSEFFFVIAREVYPRCEFAARSEAAFGASIALD
jgi:hypothetical protein